MHASAHAKRADPLSIEHLKTDLHQISARGGIFTILSQVTVFGLQTGTMIGLARLLTPADFGLYAMVTAVTGFLLLFKDLGLSNATIQKTDITQAEVSLLFWINSGISILLALLTILLAPVLSWFYHEPRLTAMVMVLSFGFFVGGFGVQHQAVLNRQMRLRAIAVSDNFSMVVGCAIALVFAWFGMSYWSLIAMQVSYFCANTAILWFLSGWRPGIPAWHANARSLLTFGSHITGATIMNYLSRNVDSFLIGRFWGPVSLGYYGRAYQLLMMPVLQLNIPFKAVAVPALSRLTDQPEKYRATCRTILDNMARVSMPAITYLIATSDWLVNVVLGPKWAESAVIFACLGVATLLQPISTSTVWIMISQGRSRDVFLSQCYAAIITVAAIILGLHWGAIGVAAAISVVELTVRTPYLFGMVGRSGPLRTADMYRACMPGLIASVVVFLAVELMRYYLNIHSPLAGLAITALPAALVAFICIYLLPGGPEAIKQMVWFVATIRNRPAKG